MSFVFKTTLASGEFYDQEFISKRDECKRFFDTVECLENYQPNVFFQGYVRTTHNTLLVKKDDGIFLFEGITYFREFANIPDASLLTLKTIHEKVIKKQNYDTVRNTHPSLEGVIPLRTLGHFIILLSLVINPEYFTGTETINLEEYEEEYVDMVEPKNYISTISLSNFSRIKE